MGISLLTCQRHCTGCSNSLANMSINSHRAITLRHTRSHDLGIKVALWNQNQPNIKTCKVCKEGLADITWFLHALHIVQFVKGTVIYKEGVMT